MQIAKDPPVMELPSDGCQAQDRQTCQRIPGTVVEEQSVPGLYDDFARRSVYNGEGNTWIRNEQSVADRNDVVSGGGEHDVGQPGEQGRQSGRSKRHDDRVRPTCHWVASRWCRRGTGTGVTRRWRPGSVMPRSR
ncbi:hypothetical protein Vlu01_36500 [Micromonospora lutea]|uniref:Uncharacterized protein n=1 Tax=Micromonospora lutea TaxID=419825 RepID=A0ABQ4IYN1_9ACTN|nr:hypothetical protein Vlu01_36500 [Micromonospora lutea]